MEDEGYDLGSTAWGSSSKQPVPEQDTVSAVVEKEKLIKEIISLQEGLKGLINRVDEVGIECEKKKAENETLQTYINNLTRQNMLYAGGK